MKDNKSTLFDGKKLTSSAKLELSDSIVAHETTTIQSLVF